MNITHRQST